MFFLSNIVVGLAINLLVNVFGDGAKSQILLIIPVIYVLGVLIPSVAVFVRRLHDTNRSGWWIFIGLVPFIGAIVLLVFLLEGSRPGDNRYGPNPNEARSSQVAPPSREKKPQHSRAYKIMNWAGFAVFFLIVLGAIFYFIRESNRASYNNLPSTLLLVQESLSEAAAAKAVGDIITVGQKNIPGYFLWENVAGVSNNIANRLGNLSNPLLDDYKRSGIAWSEEIRDAAKDPSTWKNVPEVPGDFTITLKLEQANELFHNSLAKINELAQFGDYGMSRSDKETMRYVAARLLVQKHWLNGLIHYSAADIFAGPGTTAYAYDQRFYNLCAFSPKTTPVCDSERADIIKQQLADLDAKIQDLLIDAIKYTWGNAAAKAKWLEASKQIVGMIQNDGFITEATVEQIKTTMQQKGLLPGTPAKLQAFQSDCATKGGTFGDNGQAMNVMPTLENGFYCNFKTQQSLCWDFMTYSGSGFSGGDPGCAKSNLLPSAMASDYRPAKPTQPVGKTNTAAAPTAPKPPLRNLGEPTGTAAPKIEFAVPRGNIIATVGQPFTYSFCEPPVTKGSDLCTATTNPRYGLPPYSFSLDSGGFLPFGLMLDLNGLLEGTPTAVGNRTVGICARDTGGFSVCRSVTIAVELPKQQNWTGFYTLYRHLKSSTIDSCPIEGPGEVQVQNNTLSMLEGLAFYPANKNLNTHPPEGGTLDSSASAHLTYKADERHIESSDYFWHYTITEDYHFYADTNGDRLVKGTGTYQFRDSFIPNDPLENYDCKYTIEGHYDRYRKQ